MGLGDFIGKKLSGAKEGIKTSAHESIAHERKERERRKQLGGELDDIRWNNYAKRKKLEAVSQSPNRSARAFDTFGKIGVVSNRVSEGVFSGANITPGGLGSKGVSIDPYGGDPFFSGGSKRGSRHRGRGGSGGGSRSQDIHVHVHSDGGRRRRH